MARAAVHSVQFYDSDERLIDRLCSITCSALLNGNAVLMVATPEHRTQLAAALESLDVDLRAYNERITLLDARETLGKFMVKGMPDGTLFRQVIGSALQKARQAGKGNSKGLTVYGEMVALLWAEGNSAAALALEKQWNELLQEQVFHLHCAYPRRLFANDPAGVQSVCEAHSLAWGASTATA